jgi:SAM-dependent methyltransferase
MALPTNQAAANEFDIWADNGRGDAMERGHTAMTNAAIAGWNMTADSRALDIGCGSGWTLRKLVAAGAGTATGVDIAPKMVALGNKYYADNPNCALHVAPADDLPFKDQTFDNILSIESLYYYPDPARALQEWARIAKPGAELAIAIDLFEENIATHVWCDALDIEVHLLSKPQIREMLSAAGWRDITMRAVIDPRPRTPREEFTISPYWPSYEMYENYRDTGALLIRAVKASL